MKVTNRSFIDSQELSDLLHSRGVIMVTGDDETTEDCNTYLTMDFALREITSGISKGKLEIVRFRDLPELLKASLRDIYIDSLAPKKG